MRKVNVSGMEIAYEMQGDGPPLVLLHGFLSDHRDWEPQLDGLSQDFTVIAWDAPGCGDSSDPPEDWRMAQYADCLVGFLDRIEVESAHVGGLSWGGTLAQEFYGRHRSRVRSLILADTYAGWKASLGEKAGEARLAQCIRQSYLAPEEFLPGLMPGMLSEGAPDSVVRAKLGRMTTFHPVGFRVMSHALADADTRDVWPTIAVPTLLIWGESDQRSPLLVAEEFRAGIPGAELVLIPGGHVSNMESPEMFNQAVIDFSRVGAMPIAPSS